MPGRQSRHRNRFAAAFFGLTAVTSAGAQEATPHEPQHLAGAVSLRPLFVALRGLEQHRARRPVRIMQIGDSHTANDSFSGRLRERLQERFGKAGRGWLPAGVPFAYYRPALVTVTEAGWRHVRPGDAGAGDAFGLDGAA